MPNNALDLIGVYVVGGNVQMKKKGDKMDHKWLGPYSITRVLGKGLYALKHINP